MAGSVSSAGLVVMLSSLLRIRGQHAVLLGLMVLVTVSADDPYIAGKKTPFVDVHSMIHYAVT